MRTFLAILAGLIGLVVLVAVGGWFMLQRPDIPYEQLEAKYASPASRYVDLPNGVRAHYRDEGRQDGPVLVMVHGFAASTHTWEPWIERLGADYRIVTLDLPGHGLTRAPDGFPPGIDAFADHLGAVVDRLGLAKFTLIGSSMGGHTAWIYALRHPDRLDGLVLVGAAGWPAAADEERPAAFRVLASPVGRALFGKMDSTPLMRNGLEAAFAPTPQMVDEAMLTRYVELARAPGRRAQTMALMQAERPLATPEKLAAIGVPTLIMHGDTDRLVPVADGRRFAEAIPGSTLIVYEGAGHIPMEQIADRSAADLKTWLEAEVYAAPAIAAE